MKTLGSNSETSASRGLCNDCSAEAGSASTYDDSSNVSSENRGFYGSADGFHGSADGFNSSADGLCSETPSDNYAVFSSTSCSSFGSAGNYDFSFSSAGFSYFDARATYVCSGFVSSDDFDGVFFAIDGSSYNGFSLETVSDVFCRSCVSSASGKGCSCATADFNDCYVVRPSEDRCTCVCLC